MRGLLLNVLLAVCLLGAGVSTVLAQVAGACNPQGHCGISTCTVWPGGPVSGCNCCYAGAGAWVCCDNVACTVCVGNPGAHSK